MEEQVSSNDPFAGMLGNILNNAGKENQDSDPANPDLNQLLGALTGGGAPSNAPAQGADMNAMLGALLGGASPNGASGLEGMIGAILSGGQMSSLIAPAVESLMQQMGLPRETAHQIVTFVVTKLSMSMMSDSNPATNDLLRQVKSGQGMDENYLNATGMVQELIGRTGLDANTVLASLQHVLTSVGKQMPNT